MDCLINNTIKNRKGESMNNLYACYSVKLMKYLSESGIRYELCGRHPNKEMTMWVYLRNEKLDKALSEYESSKN